MTWTRLDDNVADHPKVVAAGHLAELTYYRSLIYSNRFETDGFIAKAVVPSLSRGFERQCWQIADTLLQARLWEEHDGGYIVHDFHDYQPSKAQVQERRAARQQAGRLGGLQSGAVRRSKAEANGETTDEANPSDLVAKQMKQTRTPSRPVPSRPVLLKRETETEPGWHAANKAAHEVLRRNGASA
jgi:hypothetical protein